MVKRSSSFLRNYPWTVLLGLFIISYLSTNDIRTRFRKIVPNEFNTTFFGLTQTLIDQSPPLELLYLVAIIGSSEEADPYLQLLIPFTLHALLSGPLVGVEIILSEDLYTTFTTRQIGVLDQLRNEFGKHRLLLRTPTPDSVNLAFERCKGHAVNFVRFLERPILNAKVTFIAESDVLIVYPSEHVVSSSLRHMKALGLPYSNILRPSDKQGRPGMSNRHLTGNKHTVLSSEYYDSLKWTKIMEWFQNERDEANHPSDEALLQRMMKISHGLPSEQSSVRGSVSNQELEDELTWVDVYSWHLIWGIHLSPNRGAGKVQLLEASCKMCRMFENVGSNQVYQEFQRADKDVRNAVARVKSLCKCCSAESEDSRVCKS
jgi:hypothetical protein